MSRPQIALPPAEPIESAHPARPGAHGRRFTPEAPLPLPVASNDATPPAPPRHALRKRLLVPMTLLLATAVGSIALLRGKAPRDAASPPPRDKPPYSLTAAWRGIGQRTAPEAVHPGVPRIEDHERAAMESAPEAPAPAAAGKPSALLSTVEHLLTQLALDAVATLPEPASAAGATTADIPRHAVASTDATAPPTQPSDATPAAADRPAPSDTAVASDPSAVASVAIGQPTDMASPTVDRGPPVDEPNPDRSPEAAEAASAMPPLPRRKPAAIHRSTPDPVQPRHRPAQPLRKAPTAAPAAGDGRLEHVFKGFDHTMP